MHVSALPVDSSALLIGAVAGIRAMTAPAVVSWMARAGLLHLNQTWLAFLATSWMAWTLTVLAIGELVADQLPSTPSRTAPPGVAARLFTGAISGATIASTYSMAAGALAGIVGALIGTFGGHAFRLRMSKRFGRDRPAAMIEDLIAIGVVMIAIWLS
jgi:uncharacterized membrane protein